MDPSPHAVFPHCACSVRTVYGYLEKAIPYLCAEDEHKLKCAASGGVEALIDMLCLNPEQMQASSTRRPPR